MDDDPPNANRIGGLGYAARRIAKQSTSQAASQIATMIAAIHRQPGQHRNRNRIRHVPPKPAGNRNLRDGS